MSYIFLFLTGFLISRLSLRYGLVEQSFAWIFRSRSETFMRFLLYLLSASALVSMFTPNFLTALTLLPLLESLRQNFEQHHEPRLARRMTTIMTLVVMYGCNIGGMGSLVGSPANALMLGAMEFFKVPGREKINFLSWFGWSLPLVGILLLIAWAQVVYIFVPPKERRGKISIPALHKHLGERTHMRQAWFVTAAWFVFWTSHSALQILIPVATKEIALPGFKLSWGLWDTIAVLFGLAFIALLFAPWLHNEGRKPRALLKITECFNRLPLQAFLFVLVVLAISGFFIFIDAPQWLADRLVDLLPRELPPFLFYFTVLFMTTMTTEFFSNTAVALVLFTLMHALALSLGLNPFVMMMAIGLASTNAFMTPIGTPVNALLFGGVKNVSLTIMLISGFLLNLLSAFYMAVFLEYVVPWYYNL